MGIHQLNRFIQTYCRDAVSEMTLGQLRGERIVIDTSIYLYKYASEDALIEGMYKLITTLLYYEIIPVFVFDGVPPPEKQELIRLRKKKKYNAYAAYEELRSKILDGGGSIADVKMNKELRNYKRQCVKVHSYEIVEVKKMMDLFGVSYFTAENEADAVCAALACDPKYNIWGCLSEDTDMFVYGCPRVLRYISLIRHTVVVYEQQKILDTLNLTQTEFREVCVLSGTDYNLANKNSSIYNSYKYYNMYRTVASDRPFYDWFCDHKNVDKRITNWNKILLMFDTSVLLENGSYAMEGEPSMHSPELEEFLGKYNFVFVPARGKMY